MAQSPNACAGAGPAQGTNSTRVRQKCLLQCSIRAATAAPSPSLSSSGAHESTSPRPRGSERAIPVPGVVRSQHSDRGTKAFGIGIGERDAGAERLDHRGVPGARRGDDRAPVRQRIERHAAHAVAEFGAIVRLQADAAREIRRVLGRRRRLPDERERRIAHGFESRDVRARRGVVLAVVIGRDLDRDRDLVVPRGEQFARDRRRSRSPCPGARRPHRAGAGTAAPRRSASPRVRDTATARRARIRSGGTRRRRSRSCRGSRCPVAGARSRARSATCPASREPSGNTGIRDRAEGVRGAASARSARSRVRAVVTTMRPGPRSRRRRRRSICNSRAGAGTADGSSRRGRTPSPPTLRRSTDRSANLRSRARGSTPARGNGRSSPPASARSTCSGTSLPRQPHELRVTVVRAFRRGHRPA